MTTDPEHTNEPGTTAEAAAVPDKATPALPHHALRRTRVGGVWTAIACFAVVLLLLLIFILQNGRTVEVSYFGAHGHLPLGVALLLASVCGILLVLLPFGARIIQLRTIARRHLRDDARRLADQRSRDPQVPAADT